MWGDNRQRKKKTQGIKKKLKRRGKKTNRPSSQTSGYGDGGEAAAESCKSTKKTAATAWLAVALTGTDGSVYFPGKSLVARRCLDPQYKCVRYPKINQVLPPSTPLFNFFSTVNKLPRPASLPPDKVVRQKKCTLMSLPVIWGDRLPKNSSLIAPCQSKMSKRRRCLFVHSIRVGTLHVTFGLRSDKNNMSTQQQFRLAFLHLSQKKFVMDVLARTRRSSSVGDHAVRHSDVEAKTFASAFHRTSENKKKATQRQVLRSPELDDKPNGITSHLAS